jgi:hypothetical protein
MGLRIEREPFDQQRQVFLWSGVHVSLLMPEKYVKPMTLGSMVRMGY